MSIPSDPPRGPFQISKEGFAKLSPEDQRRVGTAMQLLVDVKTLYASGAQIVVDMLKGGIPAAEVAMKLMDFERDLRIAANDISKRPLKVLHAEAFRKGETKVDDSAWLMRCRIKASEARKARAEEAREDRFDAMAAPTAQGPIQDEPEPQGGPRP